MSLLADVSVVASCIDGFFPYPLLDLCFQCLLWGLPKLPCLKIYESPFLTPFLCFIFAHATFHMPHYAACLFVILSSLWCQLLEEWDFPFFCCCSLLYPQHLAFTASSRHFLSISWMNSWMTWLLTIFLIKFWLMRARKVSFIFYLLPALGTL